MLDGKETLFWGEITNGLDVVDAIRRRRATTAIDILDSIDSSDAQFMKQAKRLKQFNLTASQPPSGG